MRETFFSRASGLPFAAEEARTLHVSIPASAETRSIVERRYRTHKRSGEAIESLELDLSEIDEAIEAMRKKVTPTKSKKERSPSAEESLELLGIERTKGKGVEETRPQKRAKEEQSAVKGAEHKTPRKTVATPKPYYRLVTPDQWEKNK
jgi:hypothetical protein